MATRVKPQPRGKAETTDAVLDAAERLFARSGPAAVSLRDIADEAGITYSLINRHFGIKEALLIAVLDRYAARWGPVLAEESSSAAALDVLLGDSVAQGTYLRLLAWSLLHGDAGEHGERSVLDQLLPEGATRIQTNDVAAQLALVFGWRFFHPFITAALHIDEERVAATHRHVRQRVRSARPR